MSEPLTIVASSLVLGFAGSVHCVAMCGGIASALAHAGAAAQPRPGAIARAALATSLGRIASYATAGALAGGVGGSLGGFVAAGSARATMLRIVLGLVLLGVGVELCRSGRAFAPLERAGGLLWRRVSPLLRRIGRPERVGQLVAMGAIWGWLPCGLVYSGLVVAAASGRADLGALAMASFGLGTLPAVAGASGLSNLLARFGGAGSVRRRAGVVLVAFGLWSLIGTWLFTGGHHHAHP